MGQAAGWAVGLNLGNPNIPKGCVWVWVGWLEETRDSWVLERLFLSPGVNSIS